MQLSIQRVAVEAIGDAQKKIANGYRIDGWFNNSPERQISKPLHDGKAVQVDLTNVWRSDFLA